MWVVSVRSREHNAPATLVEDFGLRTVQDATVSGLCRALTVGL